MTIKEALAKCLSNSDEVSFGRTACAISTLCCLAWDTFFVAFAAHKLDFNHMQIKDILPPEDILRGQVMFCAAFYSITKIGDLANAFSQIFGNRK